MEPGTIAAGMEITNTALELIGKIRGYAKSAGNKDLNEAILALHEQLLALSETNLLLRQRVTEVEAAAKTRAEMIYDGVVYWANARKKSPEDGPYCPGCLDSSGKSARLRSTGDGCWYCMVCNQGISGPDAPSGIRTARTEYDPLGELGD